ncbi:hypothetical protein BDN70DRAFT_511916 [Pholiota conissans]|uniref:Uncharacterized protein n=1 Tax=Pholiota conissans TaxID=109636 RepID=A0A9P5Z5A8_9AGAR|nr:hypothetical protein BDN70DRAFT_511916 [Pholiota conissans]
MTGEPAKTKPTTRSSLRQSLNLASVGKALGFAESSTTSAAKNTKKNKDPAASRRHSALVLPVPAAPRASMGDSRPPSLRTATPEAKPATTRKRGSMSLNRPGSSADESSAPSKADSAVSPQPISSSGRVATLRPRNLNAAAPAASALPKYRPKSVALEVAKPPSPVLVRAGTRRRLSTSDDEKRAEQQNKPIGAAPSVSVEKKYERPISPLPQRAALTANLTNGLTPSPHSSPSRPKAPASGNGKAASGSPSRPNKIVKTSAAATTTTTASRPGSASTPKGSTPKTSGLKAKLGLSGKTGASTATPSNGHRSYSPLSRDTPSPLAHRSRPPSTKLMTSSSASASGASSSSASMAASSGAGNMSHISEANSADEEDDDADIELLLAPVAALSAPTPAMPRIQPGRKRLAPQTPTRPPGGLPSRAEMSYLSPAPPDESSPAPNRSSKNGSSSQQRPVPIARLQLPSGRAPPTAAQEKAMRGSIMSWEQLANEASVSLGEDEFGRMLSDIPAPFRSGAASPSLSSQMSTGLPGGPGGGGGSMPASPLLLSTSSLDASPGAYGSISQVLLPDVTPSPAAYMHASARYNNLLAPLDGSKSGSGGKTTMLRLQLAAAERQAAEREAQIRALEEELHELARAGAQQAEESAAQIAYMEQQWRAERAATAAAAAQTQNTQMDEDDDEEEQDDTLTLPEVERMLNDAKYAHEREVQRVWEEAEAARMQEVQRESLRGVLCASAAAAEARWGAVHTACSAEIDVVRDERAVLKLLLVQLDALAKGVFV